MKIDLVIPTKNRKQKLTNCLNSVFRSAKDIKIDIHIYFDSRENLAYFDTILGHIETIHLKMLDEYRVPTFWNGFLEKSSKDVLIYLNDDVEFFEDTLREIIKVFKSNFPDCDGVLGLNQVNIKDPNKVKAAFGVIGIKYSDRFPDRQVFCPDYHRFFGDYELWRYAKEIGRFVFGDTAQILHHHPVTNRKLEDETHNSVRVWLSKDRQTFKERQQKNLLWGRDWDLIT